MRILAGMIYGDADNQAARKHETLYWGTRGKIEREAWRVMCENVFAPASEHMMSRRKPLPPDGAEKKGDLPEWIWRLHYRHRTQKIMQWALTDENVSYILFFFHPDHGEHREWWNNRLAAPRSKEDLAAVNFFRLFLEALWSGAGQRRLSLGVLAHARRTIYQWLKGKRRLPLLGALLTRDYQAATAWERLLLQSTESAPHFRLRMIRARMLPKRRPRVESIAKMRGLVRISNARILKTPVQKLKRRF